MALLRCQALDRQVSSIGTYARVLPPMTETVITGGCLCGEVRYELNGPPLDMGTCHCRNCQRWSGSAFHSAVAFALTDLSFTKNEPLRYQSSSIMERSFCPSCGSPLLFRYLVPIEDLSLIHI